MNSNRVIQEIDEGKLDSIFQNLYIDPAIAEMQRERYKQAILHFAKLYGAGEEIEIYSAPGRSEIGGNHTDHQQGKVIAASVNLDSIAVVSRRKDGLVVLKSEGYSSIQLDLDDLNPREEEKESTAALIRGVAAGMKKRGLQIGGFNAYVTSEVLSGSGLSSSAAFEVLTGNIISGLYNEDRVDAITIAQVGQEAENQYFGKPSGLMDQMASSVGGLTYIDFENPAKPEVRKIKTDFSVFGYSLCIVDTKGSHADLTGDYAAVPVEMKQVAACFGKDVLRQVNEEEFYQNLPQTREKTGDRPILRAIHFFEENKRVEEEKGALEQNDFERFKRAVLSSGESSYKYLQNVYPMHHPESQGLAVALVLSEKLLKNKGAWRVHGGGFAGTIQAFVPDDFVPEYQKQMDRLFGAGACHVLKIRPVGGTRVI